MDALNAESELNLKRFESEQIKIENYHQALLEKRLNEQESKFRSKIESTENESKKYEKLSTER
jgi:t-SNARE complex subunit (syntaxin)